MEAGLFTLDIVLLVLLIVAVRTADREAPAQRHLGLFSYLQTKTDEVQKGLRIRKGDPGA